MDRRDSTPSTLSSASLCVHRHTHTHGAPLISFLDWKVYRGASQFKFSRHVLRRCCCCCCRSLTSNSNSSSSSTSLVVSLLARSFGFSAARLLGRTVGPCYSSKARYERLSMRNVTVDRGKKKQYQRKKTKGGKTPNHNLQSMKDRD